MISNFSTPSLTPTGSGSGTGGSNKIIIMVALVLGGFLLWKFVIKPEMDKQKTIINESSNEEFE